MAIDFSPAQGPDKPQQSTARRSREEIVRDSLLTESLQLGSQNISPNGHEALLQPLEIINKGSINDRFAHAEKGINQKMIATADQVKRHRHEIFDCNGIGGLFINPWEADDTKELSQLRSFVWANIWHNDASRQFHLTLTNESAASEIVSDFKEWVPKATARLNNTLKWADAAGNFKALDTNNNGVIDRSELAVKYDPKNSVEFYRQFDRLATANKNKLKPGVSKAAMEELIGDEMTQKDNKWALNQFELFKQDEVNGNFRNAVNDQYGKLDANHDNKIDKTELQIAIQTPKLSENAKKVAQILLDNYDGFRQAGRLLQPLPLGTETINMANIVAFQDFATDGSRWDTNISKSNYKRAITQILENNMTP